MPLWPIGTGSVRPAPTNGERGRPVAGYIRPCWPDPSRPQQAHLDVRVEDLNDVGEAQALALGASRLGDGDETFRVFADLAGNPFCLTV